MEHSLCYHDNAVLDNQAVRDITWFECIHYIVGPSVFEINYILLFLQNAVMVLVLLLNQKEIKKNWFSKLRLKYRESWLIFGQICNRMPQKKKKKNHISINFLFSITYEDSRNIEMCTYA